MPENVLFLSDIHGNFYALQAILDEVNNHTNKVDYVICLGDLVGYGPFPNEVINLARRFNICLLGNHDLVPINRGGTEGFNPTAKKAIDWTCQQLTPENKHFLQTECIQQQKLTLKDNSIYICHGSPYDLIYDYLLPTDPEEKKRRCLELAETPFLFVGHTHIPMDYSCDLGCIINPGSVGQPRDGNADASALIWQIKGKNDYELVWLRAKYDIVATARAIRGHNLPHLLSERLFFGK